MTTEVDKRFMLTTGKSLLAEPFDFGRNVVGPSPDPLTSETKGEGRGREDSLPDPSLLQQFADETSAHGCAHVASPRRGTLRSKNYLGLLLPSTLKVIQGSVKVPCRR
ncbi:hypothetical protein ACOMHN_023992 [Nucella lapillus]